MRSPAGCGTACICAVRSGARAAAAQLPGTAGKRGDARGASKRAARCAVRARLAGGWQPREQARRSSITRRVSAGCSYPTAGAGARLQRHALLGLAAGPQRERERGLAPRARKAADGAVEQRLARRDAARGRAPAAGRVPVRRQRAGEAAALAAARRLRARERADGSSVLRRGIKWGRWQGGPPIPRCCWRMSLVGGHSRTNQAATECDARSSRLLRARSGLSDSLQARAEASPGSADLLRRPSQRLSYCRCYPLPACCAIPHDVARIQGARQRAHVHMVEHAVAVDVRVQARRGQRERAQRAPAVQVHRLQALAQVGHERIGRQLAGRRCMLGGRGSRGRRPRPAAAARRQVRHLRAGARQE